MKALFLSMSLLAVSYAQDFVGTWQGTLKAGTADLRIVYKITLEDEKLKAVMYSIDQGGQPLSANSVSKSGSALKLKVDAINGSYEGKLNSDGNSITGNWTQGSAMPLNLVRTTPQTAWTIPEPPPPTKSMPADAKPTFEVATIKPSRAESRFSLLVNRSGMLNTTSSTLADLIKFAYDLHPRQITGGPSWLTSEKFDVSGKPDTAGMPSVKQLKSMVQGLLTDRFQLTFHHDSKELSVYAITIAKTGIKMSKNDSNPNGLPGFGGGPRRLNVRNATITEFASMLQANILDQPVVDQTGLGTSRFDFVLSWTPDGPQSSAASADSPDAPPDLFAAFQQQLGLRLQSSKAAVGLIVIDRAEKPSEN